MKRYLGTVLIVFSVICILATFFLLGWGITHPSQHPSNDRRQNDALISAILLSAIGILGGLLLISGLYLRRSSKPKHDDVAGVYNNWRLFPLVLYLGGSIGLAMLGYLALLKDINIGPLWVLVSQPSSLFHIVPNTLGFKLDSSIINNVLLVLFHIVYFMVLLYPLYRIVTLDRIREKTRIKLMKIILILLCSLHMLIVFFLMVATRD
jgi:hypothetical protein